MWIGAVALEATKAGTVNPKRSQKLGLKIIPASGGVSRRGSNPFVDLNDAHFFEELRPARVTNGQLFIGASRRAAGRSA